MRENRTYGLKRGANVILKLVATSLHQKQEVSLNDFDYYICFYSTANLWTKKAPPLSVVSREEHQSRHYAEIVHSIFVYTGSSTLEQFQQGMC